MSKPSKKATYRVKNWAEYNRALIQRGSLTIWVDPDATKAWNYNGPTHRGAPYLYSDLAITCLLTMRAVFHLPLRATQGLACSILGLMGLTQPVPHYSTLSRRAAKTPIDLAQDVSGAVHLLIDSTGLKVFGEGEWKVRQHDYSKRRTWRKLHLAIDANTHQILSMSLTEAGVDDADQVKPLVDAIEQKIDSMSGDGAFDKRKVYEILAKRTDRVNIPPRRGARIWQHGNSSKPRLVRDENLRVIRKSSRKTWKKRSGYHRRSLVETCMFRMKTIFGSKLANRTIPTQRTEAAVRVRALNIMTRQGMPKSQKVA